MLGNAVKSFLENPDREFSQFYKACAVRVRSIVYQFLAASWKFSGVSIRDENSCNNLATDILTNFSKDYVRLAKEMQKYFDDSGILVQSADTAVVEAHFMPFLYRKVFQEASKIYHANCPVKKNYKRNPHEKILIPPEYLQVPGRPDCIAAAKYMDNPRYEAEPIPPAQLLHWAAKWLDEVTLDRTLCTMLFREINDREEFQNFVNRDLVISALVEARYNFFLSRLPHPAEFSAPDESITLAKVDGACKAARERYGAYIENDLV